MNSAYTKKTRQPVALSFFVQENSLEWRKSGNKISIGKENSNWLGRVRSIELHRITKRTRFDFIKE